MALDIPTLSEDLAGNYYEMICGLLRGDGHQQYNNMTEKEFNESDAEFIILLKAINDTYSQTVYSRMSYKPKEVVWNAKFTPVKTVTNNKGGISINLKDIHVFEKI